MMKTSLNPSLVKTRILGNNEIHCSPKITQHQLVIVSVSHRYRYYMHTKFYSIYCFSSPITGLFFLYIYTDRQDNTHKQTPLQTFSNGMQHAIIKDLTLKFSIFAHSIFSSNSIGCRIKK